MWETANLGRTGGWSVGAVEFCWGPFVVWGPLVQVVAVKPMFCQSGHEELRRTYIMFALLFFRADIELLWSFAGLAQISVR